MSQTDTSIRLTETGLQLEGSLTFDTVSSLLKEGKEKIESTQSKTIVIDLERVSRIDSAGISLLIEWKRLCKKNKNTLLLEGMQKQAASLIKTYRLQALL